MTGAVAVSKVRGPDAALAMIEPLADRLGGYFHFHGLKGGLLLQLGRHRQAREAFDRAIALANSPAEAAHIRLHIDRLNVECRAAQPRKAEQALQQRIHLGNARIDEFQRLGHPLLDEIDDRRFPLGRGRLGCKPPQILNVQG